VAGSAQGADDIGSREIRPFEQQPHDKPIANPFLPRGGDSSINRGLPVFPPRLVTEFMDAVAQPLLDFIKAHSDWAALVMFITAFGESFAFISLLFPGTTVLIAAGTLLSDGTLPYASILIGAVLGAVLGDSVSYWLGRNFGGGIARIWPFSRHPELLSRGILFFERHGGKSVFVGRFFGPVRAVIPLAAGIMQMRRGRFWFANVTSALVWAPMLLFVGDAVGEVGDRLIGSTNTVLLVFGGLTLIGIVGAVWVALRAVRPKS
jgi:membrane protein DedA with SNARE-associated domain